MIRRRAFAALLLLAVCALPLVARAQEFAPDTLSYEDRYASPQWFAIEFKLGPYTPNLDSGLSGATPFADLFGDGFGALMFQGEFDVQLWKGFGIIGAGLSLGYYSNSAAPFADDGGVGKPASGTTRVSGDTSITLLPIALLAVYRFDVLAERWNIPLVPYAKIGLTYTFWWIRKGNGDVASYEGDEAKGGTFGWQLNLGLALRLDIFEPDAAKSLDINAGINHSYLFFEFFHHGADGFGSATALDVGDTTWLAGLAIEF